MKEVPFDLMTDKQGGPVPGTKRNYRQGNQKGHLMNRDYPGT